MRTKTRLYLSIGALALLVFVLAIVSIVTIWRLSGEGRDLLKANYASIEYMQGMLAAMDGTGDRDEAVVRMRELLGRQQSNITEVGEDTATAALDSAMTEWARTGGDTTSTGQLRARIQTVTDLNRSAILRKVASAENRGEKALVWVSLTGTFCALIALSLLFSIPEHLVDPIRKLTEGIDRIATGNYRERVDLRRSDEFGHMADRFNAMAAELERWENSNLARIMEEKARVEAVLHSLQDASIGLDEQGRVLFANQQALDLLSVGSEDLIGRTREELARTNDLLDVMLSGTGRQPLKIVKDGREQFFSLEHLPIMRSGERLGTMVVLRNVTPFEEKDRAKSHFLATISHELKTPLASTDIGLTLLERQQAARLGPDQAAIVSDLRKDHQRLVRIVSELLDIVQVETGKIRVDLGPCALNHLMEEALAAVKVAGQQKDILFARRPEAEELDIRADADKAVWVLVNVLGNAVRHSPQRGIITLEVSAAHGEVSLSVTDQGPGVPEQERGRLFQRFAPGSETSGGTGLGLAIAREFMLAMGGAIAYRPSEEEGATFILTFAAV